MQTRGSALFRQITFISFVVLLFLFDTYAYAQPQEQTIEASGEIFGVPVPRTNYLFVKSAVAVFGNRWGEQPKNAEEFEDMVWEQMVLSFEAFRENIEISPEEFNAGILKLLKREMVAFDYKKDKALYENWVKEKTKGPVELFENQIRHLLQIEKLRAQVMDSIDPQVSEEEVHQEFLNERNSLSLELAAFSDIKSAEEFYNNVKQNPQVWEEEKKKQPQAFKKPGFVSLEFLMDIWRIPKDACFKMLELTPQEFYGPEPLYEGFAVFKVLEVGRANEADYEKLRNSYYEQVKNRKKLDGLNEWLKVLKQQAKIRIYKKGG